MSKYREFFTGILIGIIMFIATVIWQVQQQLRRNK
jgi:hypothetical protein